MKSAASHAYTIASFFHWDAIPKFNQIAEQEMRSVSNKETELGRRFGLLDVYPMSILRPDARRSRRMSRRRECPRERDAERLRALCTAGRAGLVESPAANAAQRTLELRAER